jgi:hypothetical protein
MALPYDSPDAPGETTLGLLRRHSVSAAVIAVVLAATVGGFAYVGGFVSPGRLSSGRMADALEATGGGAHVGFRRAHAKGICIAGTFTGSAAARGLSRAAVFGGDAVPVTGRFAEPSTGWRRRMADGDERYARPARVDARSVLRKRGRLDPRS